VEVQVAHADRLDAGGAGRGGLFRLLDGALGAIDAATGQPKWVLPTEYDRKFEAKNLHGLPSAAQTIPDAWDLFTSSPAVANGKVFFGSGDGGVYAADAVTGVLQWKFSTGDVVHASPAVANGTVFVGSWTARSMPSTPTPVSRVEVQGGRGPCHPQPGRLPVVAGGRDGTVYVGCRDAHVYALDAVTGRKIWDYPTSKSWGDRHAGGARRRGLRRTSDSARFMALDAKNGRLKFNFDAKAYVFSSAALAGDLAYVGDPQRPPLRRRHENRKLAWQFQTEASKPTRSRSSSPTGLSTRGVRSGVRRLPGHVHRHLAVHLGRGDHVVARDRSRRALRREHGRARPYCRLQVGIQTASACSPGQRTPYRVV